LNFNLENNMPPPLVVRISPLTAPLHVLTCQRAKPAAQRALWAEKVPSRDLLVQMRGSGVRLELDVGAYPDGGRWSSVDTAYLIPGLHDATRAERFLARPLSTARSSSLKVNMRWGSHGARSELQRQLKWISSTDRLGLPNRSTNCWGELLLADRQRAEATAAFERVLVMYPNRRLALEGIDAAKVAP